MAMVWQLRRIRPLGFRVEALFSCIPWLEEVLRLNALTDRNRLASQFCSATQPFVKAGVCSSKFVGSEPS